MPNAVHRSGPRPDAPGGPRAPQEDPAPVPAHVAWVLGDPRPVDRADPADPTGRVLTELVDAALALGVRWFTLQVTGPPGAGPDAALTAALEGLLHDGGDDLDAAGVRLRWSGGGPGATPGVIHDRLAAVAARTAGHDRFTLTLVFDGGGRVEILEALERLAADGSAPAAVTEAVVAGHLHWPDMPDPDLVVVGGDTPRVPDFLLWEGAYAEFVFGSPGWAGLGRHGFADAVAAYQHRQRRYGGLGG